MATNDAHAIVVTTSGDLISVRVPPTQALTFEWIRRVFNDNIMFVSSTGEADAIKMALFTGTHAKQRNGVVNSAAITLLQGIGRSTKTILYGPIIFLAYEDFQQYGIPQHMVSRMGVILNKAPIDATLDETIQICNPKIN